MNFLSFLRRRKFFENVKVDIDGRIQREPQNGLMKSFCYEFSEMTMCTAQGDNESTCLFRLFPWAREELKKDFQFLPSSLPSPSPRCIFFFFSSLFLVGNGVNIALRSLFGSKALWRGMTKPKIRKKEKIKTSTWRGPRLKPVASRAHSLTHPLGLLVVRGYMSSPAVVVQLLSPFPLVISWALLRGL